MRSQGDLGRDALFCAHFLRALPDVAAPLPGIDAALYSLRRCAVARRRRHAATCAGRRIDARTLQLPPTSSVQKCAITAAHAAHREYRTLNLGGALFERRRCPRCFLPSLLRFLPPTSPPSKFPLIGPLAPGATSLPPSPTPPRQTPPGHSPPLLCVLSIPWVPPCFSELIPVCGHGRSTWPNPACY